MRKFQSDDPLMAYVVRYFAEYQAVVLEDEYGDPRLENNWFPAVFAYHYDAIVASVPFTRERYEAHGRLRELLAGLALNPESRLPKPTRDAEKREGDVSRFAGFSREQRPDEADYL